MKRHQQILQWVVCSHVLLFALRAQSQERTLSAAPPGELRRFDLPGEPGPLALSSDGRRAASAVRLRSTPEKRGEIDPYVILVWDLETGAELNRLECPCDWMVDLDFSADGRQLLSADTYGARLWDIASGEEVQWLPQNPLRQAKFHPDGLHAVLASAVAQAYISVWELRTGREVRRLPTPYKGPFLAASANGKQILHITTEKVENPSAGILDLESGRELLRLSAPPSLFRNNYLSFSSDGGRALWSCDSGEFRLWDTHSGKDVCSHQGPCHVMLLAPDGRHAVALQGSRLQVWDLSSNQPVRTIGTSSFFRLKLSTDGQFALTNGGDKSVKMWRLSYEPEPKPAEPTPLPPALPLPLVSWPPVNTGPVGELRSIQIGEGVASIVAISPDERYAASLIHRRGPSELLIWEIESGEQVAQLQGQRAIRDIAFSPDSQRLISSGEDLRMWDIASGKELARMATSNSPLVQFHPGGRHAVASAQNDLVVWDIVQGLKLRQFRAPMSNVLIAVPYDGRRALVAGGDDSRAVLSLLDLDTGKPLLDLPVPPGRISSVSLSADGSRALTLANEGDRRSVFRHWDLAKGKLLSSGVGSATMILAPDGRHAVGMALRNMHIWDLASGKVIRQIPFGEGRHYFLKLSSRGGVAVTGGNQVRLWRLSYDAETIPLGVAATTPPRPLPVPEHISEAKLVAPPPPTLPIKSTLVIGRPEGSRDPQSPYVAELRTLSRGADPGEVNSHDQFAHELVRQSLLLAARDMGLLTRDESLGETATDDKLQASVKLELSSLIAAGQDATLSLTAVAKDDTRNVVWESKLPLAERDFLDYRRLAEAAEGWSRTAFTDALAKAGAPRSKVGPAPPAAPAVDEQLDSLSLLQQFAAIRSLHAQLRRGHSPALLESLARGYANLGLLSEFHWSQAHKALKARSVLYASRILQQSPANARGAWHRAYAWALAGQHQFALDDLATADRLAATSNTTDKPDWVSLIDAYCRFDAKTLAQAQSHESVSRLAALLQFLVDENPDTRSITLSSAANVLDKDPECLRVIDGMCNAGGVSNLHRATELGPLIFSSELATHLPNMSGLPADAHKLIEVAQDEGLDEAKLVDALDQGGAPKADGNEFSWRVLAQLIRETHFVHVWRRAAFMKYDYSVPVEEYLEETAPLVTGHPHRRVIKGLSVTPGPVSTAPLQLEALDRSGLPIAAQAIYLRTSVRDSNKSITISRRLKPYADSLYGDLAAWINLTEFESGLSVAQRLAKVSPYSPVAVGARVRRNDPAASDLVSVGRQFGQHAFVLRNLALMAELPEEKHAYWEAYIKRSPDYSAYRSLADLYRRHGDTDRWQQTLEAFLAQPSTGLEHAHIRIELARHFASLKQWDKAVPFADAGADSYAAWAMQAAARVNEEAGNLDRAQLWLSRIAQRYGHLALYNSWCLKHKRLPPQDLTPLPADQLEAWSNVMPPESLYILGAICLAENKTEDALDFFYRAVVDIEQPRERCYNGLFLAILADELKETKLRDAALAMVANTDAASQARSRQLARLIQRHIAAGGNVRPDLDAIDQSLKGASLEDMVNLTYFVGRFLQVRGQTQSARQYYQRTLNAKEGSSYINYKLAAKALKMADADKR